MGFKFNLPAKLTFLIPPVPSSSSRTSTNDSINHGCSRVRYRYALTNLANRQSPASFTSHMAFPRNAVFTSDGAISQHRQASGITNLNVNVVLPHATCRCVVTSIPNKGYFVQRAMSHQSVDQCQTSPLQRISIHHKRTTGVRGRSTINGDGTPHSSCAVFMDRGMSSSHYKPATYWHTSTGTDRLVEMRHQGLVASAKMG